MTIANRLFSAISQLTASNAIVRLLSIVTMPLLTRLLAPEAYGVAALASSVISLCSIIAITGMGMTYARTFHETSSPSGKEIEVFVWRYTLGNGILAAFLCVLAWELVAADYYNLPGYLGVIIAASIFLNVAKRMAEVRARLNNLYTKLSLSIAASGFGAAMISLGVAFWWRQDELPLILALFGGGLISLIMLGIPGLRVLLTPSGLSRDERINVLKIGLPAIVTAPAFWVLSSLDLWLLSYFQDAQSVGIYSIGCSVALMGMMINNAIHSVWLPEVSRLYESDMPDVRHELGRLIEPLILTLGIVWLAVTSAGGDVIRLLASPRFHEAAGVIPYVSASVFFYGILHLANAILLLKKKLSYAIPWWFIGALICLGINCILIQEVGLIGAAYTRVLAFAFVTCGIIYSAQKLFPIKLRWGRILLIMAVLFVFGIFMSPPWSESSLVSLLLKFPVGLAVSLAMFVLTSPGIIEKSLSRIRVIMK